MYLGAVESGVLSASDSDYREYCQISNSAATVPVDANNEEYGEPFLGARTSLWPLAVECHWAVSGGTDVWINYESGLGNAVFYVGLVLAFASLVLALSSVAVRPKKILTRSLQ